MTKHRWWRVWAGAGLLAAAGLLLSQVPAQALPAGGGPPGFWWGTDSLPVAVPGGAPYAMPFVGGAYGGYIGMTGNWAYWQGCGGQEHFNAPWAGQGARGGSTLPPLPR